MFANDYNEGENNMKFAERLVKLREIRGLTQSKLAKKANISSRAIQYYENGERQPKGDNLIKLANALDIPESALLSDEGLSVFLANHSSSGIRNNTIRNSDGKIIKAVAIGGPATVASLMLNPLIMTPIKAVGVGLGLIGRITGISGSFNTIKSHSNMKEIYKELSRIEALVVILNDKIDSYREEYERLAINTQQDDAEIAEFKKFIEISKLLSVYQEYRSLLKQKGKYCSLLINEVESNSAQNSKIINKILEEIKNAEIKEREYAEIILNNHNETNDSISISEDNNE